MNVYKINEYDLVVEDRVNGYVRVIILNRNEGLKPITWTIPYGRNFIEDFVDMLIYRTNDIFKNDFIKYCQEHNIFQEVMREVEEKTNEK